MATSDSPTRQHAVVIGGSIAGLLAARVLADHFAHVTIVERDQFPDAPIFRPGVPQARQVHVLLVRGQQLLEHYLPGFTANLQKHQGHIVSFTDDLRLSAGNYWLPQFPGTIPFVSCSRPLLEWTVRQEVLRHTNITTLPLQEATGLLATPDRTHITGVQVRARDGQAPDLSPTTDVLADLVVDATGRHSHAAEWLQALGYAAPPTTHIDAHIGYATRVVRLPPAATPPWKGMYIMANPPTSLRGGLITQLEGTTDWIVGLVGCGGTYPPTDDAGFLEFARNLAYPDLYEVIKDAETLTPIYGYRDTSNLLHHYEQMRRFPESLVVVGDAVAAFNPIYGQGMTTATLGAAQLDAQLRRQGTRSLDGLGRRFQRALAKDVAVPWQFSTSGDFRVPGVTGGKATFTINALNGYLDRLYWIMPKSRRAHLAFLNAINMSAPPTALFHPAILGRVLFARRPKG